MKRSVKHALALMLTVIMIVGALTGTTSAATHTVVKGDNLSKLAETYLGDDTRWVEIYEANKDILPDPNQIYVGQQLVIPDGSQSNDLAQSETPTQPSTPADIQLTVNPNYEGALTQTLARQSGDLVFKVDTGMRPARSANNVPSVSRRGYNFTGWYYDAACTRPVGGNDTMDTNLTIYAGWTPWDADTTAWMDMVLTEVEYIHYICDRPNAYTAESFARYIALAMPIRFLSSGGVLPREMEGLVYGLAAARQQLELAEGVTDPEDTIWYIWDDDMPAASEASDYSYYGSWDNAGFKPFLIPYLQEDQSQVKGNIILISGGGFNQRCDYWEGYPGVEAFFELGYNCFVLERRVAPSTPLDAGLDLQRSIRYLRYYAEEYGIGGIENIACAGYSGGGGTITIAVEQCYGYITPDAYYPDYQCDDVDRVNSDMDTMIMIYSALPLETENPNIPDAFVVIGTDDVTVSPEYQLLAISYYREHGVRYEAHFFSDAAHGFGQGFGLNSITYTDEDVYNVKIWPQLADTFMSIQYGFIQNVTTLGQ